MRTHRRSVFAAAAPIAAAALVSLLVLSAVVPVLAKEGLEARLDAPIGLNTPGGTVLLVGMMVTAPDDHGGAPHPVEGTPVYLRLTGRDGSTTEASGAVRFRPRPLHDADRDAPGRAARRRGRDPRDV